MPRFNRKDTVEIKNARAVLKNPNATAEEKASAGRTITRLNTDRTRRIEARKSAGSEPRPGDFDAPEQYQSALRKWWSELDKLVAQKEAHKILADPNSSTYLRQKAYDKLGITQETESDREELSTEGKKDDRGPSREDFGFRSGHDWPEFVASGKEAEFQTALEEWRQTASPMDPKLAALFK